MNTNYNRTDLYSSISYLQNLNNLVKYHEPQFNEYLPMLNYFSMELEDLNRYSINENIGIVSMNNNVLYNIENTSLVNISSITLLIMQFSRKLYNEYNIDYELYDSDSIIEGEFLNPYNNFSIFRGIAPKEAMNGPVMKIKVLLEVELNFICEDVCGICLENHKKIDSVVCCCSHEFGNDCFNGWMNNRHALNEDVTCPSCRTVVTEITHFGGEVV